MYDAHRMGGNTYTAIYILDEFETKVFRERLKERSITPIGIWVNPSFPWDCWSSYTNEFSLNKR